MSILIYSSIFAVLIGSTAFELAIIGFPLPTRILTTLIMGLAGLKAVLIALFFQHLRHEPKALSLLLLMALGGAIVLITISLLQIGAMMH